MSSLATAVRAALVEALPEIARRAGRDRIDELVVEVLDAPGDTVVRKLAACLVTLSQERERVLRRVEADTQVLRAAVASGKTRHALEDAVQRLSAGRLREDRRALGRWLDASAIEDRLVHRRHAVDQAWEFLALAVARAPVEQIGQVERDELRRATLQVLSDRAVRWPIRVAAARLAAPLGDPGRTADTEGGVIRGVLRRMSRDASDDPWVQSATLEAWLSWCTRAEAASLLGYVLLRPEDAVGALHRDHDFARARAAGLAAASGAWALLREAAATARGGEHVRMAIVRALATSPHREDRDAVARRLVSTPDDWRIAAAGAVTLIATAPDAGDVLAGPLAQAPPRAANVVLDALQARLRDGRIGVEAGTTIVTDLRPALERWSQATDQPDLARLAVVLPAWARLHADPRTHAALTELAGWVTATPEGRLGRFRRGPVATLTSTELLDVLFVLAHEDVDLAATPLGRLDLDDPGARPTRGWTIHVGLTRVRAGWRMLHELRHPRNDKRQAHPHTTDERPAGPLVAWSGRMAEVVATGVPGQRAATPTTLSWGEHLPLPSNLLASLRYGTTVVRGPWGRVVLKPASWRARFGAHGRYVALADLRERLSALPPDEAARVYDDAVRKAGFLTKREPTALLGLTPALLAERTVGWLRRAGASDSGTYGELAVISSAALAFFVVRHTARELRIRAWRRKVPFVVGGWGSRGKSSVERLKAAMFQGLGYTVLCKSTGCEAMLLAAWPGADPVEVFLYRPRDKATIVEQQRVLEIAASLQPQVLLYECMALNPLYVTILQRDWMRDDMTTLTNTYPDHEDIQGPAGRDVADVISLFTPFAGHVVSSEHHMTPVLERRARERATTFLGCRPEDWDLIPRDLLARFPDQAYDRNVALVAELGRALGIPHDVALRTMADHVLIDLGAFKRYGPIDVEGRSLAYLAGNSANDRASFLSNWDRGGVATFDTQSGLTKFLVVVINNRGDRLARQAMFSRIAALDIAADRVVIIGTNVVQMHEQIRGAFREVLVPRLLEIGHGPDGQRKLFELFHLRLRRSAVGANEAEALLSEARSAWEASDVDAGTVPTSIEATWREETAWLAELGRSFDLNLAIDRFVAFLARRIVPFPDSAVSGDRILHDVAAMFPGGTHAELLGCANIKGTGLDLVYRWVGIERVQGWVRDAAGDVAPTSRERLEKLSAYADYGLYDARFAATALGELRGRGVFARLGVEDEAEAALATVERAVREREARRNGGGPKASSVGDRIRRWLRPFDLVGNYRRRRDADRLLDDLATQRVGLVRAAQEAKKLVEGEKK